MSLGHPFAIIALLAIIAVFVPHGDASPWATHEGMALPRGDQSRSYDGPGSASCLSVSDRAAGGHIRRVVPRPEDSVQFGVLQRRLSRVDGATNRGAAIPSQKSTVGAAASEDSRAAATADLRRISSIRTDGLSDAPLALRVPWPMPAGGGFVLNELCHTGSNQLSAKLLRFSPANHEAWSREWQLPLGFRTNQLGQIPVHHPTLRAEVMSGVANPGRSGYAQPTGISLNRRGA